ncbi:MAG TPA: BON domain-containing protein [Candidatus Binataceae bacterium]|nr:BON domain-containing protein [Candidatus Binataceae bacterium]
MIRSRIHLKVALSLMLFCCSIVSAQLAEAKTKLTLAQRVTAALRADDRLNGAECYQAAPGVIVLHGTVFDQKSRALAEITASNVTGVTQVINGLLTKTGEWMAEQQRINDTLALNGFPDLTVRVIGNTAYLSGTVTGDDEQQRALRVIASISKLQVVNFSRVLPGSVF